MKKIICMVLLFGAPVFGNDSNFDRLKEALKKSAEKVIYTNNLVKKLVKRDLTAELQRLWDRLPPPDEILALQKEYDNPVIGSPAELSEILTCKIKSTMPFLGMTIPTDPEMTESTNQYDKKFNRMTRQELYIEMQILRLENECKRYLAFTEENKVKERPFLINPEDLRSFQLADRIAANPKAGLELDANRQRTIKPPPAIAGRKYKIMILNNDAEYKVVMMVESGRYYQIKTVDGKTLEIPKVDVLEIRE